MRVDENLTVMKILMTEFRKKFLDEEHVADFSFDVETEFLEIALAGFHR
jgi:hypothetical protein